MTVDLTDAQDKLRWARKHLNVLRPEVQAFTKRDTHSFTFDVQPDAGEYVFYVHDLETPPPEWGLIIGDCLHNARAALDYLMVRLYSLVIDQPPVEIGGVQFPIYDKPERFASAPSITRARKHPTFSGYLARIEELQPYNLENPSIWGRDPDGAIFHPVPDALDQLTDLDNIDKHRVVHATWTEIDYTESTTAKRRGFPHGFNLIGSGVTRDPLENDAYVGYWRFSTPLPENWHEWKPNKMDMDPRFPIHVAIGEPPTYYDTLKVLTRCLRAVEAVLALFEPVFVGRPPLPVTALPDHL